MYKPGCLVLIVCSQCFCVKSVHSRKCTGNVTCRIANRSTLNMLGKFLPNSRWICRGLRPRVRLRNAARQTLSFNSQRSGLLLYPVMSLMPQHGWAGKILSAVLVPFTLMLDGGCTKYVTHTKQISSQYMYQPHNLINVPLICLKEGFFSLFSSFN